MKQVMSWLIISALLGASGCNRMIVIFEGDRSTTTEPQESPAPTPTPEVITSTTLFVDPQTGSDRNSGTANQPFKTITYALQQAKSGTTIRLRPGVYTDKTGEVFPLQIKSGVTLVGYPETRGKDIQIVGGGKYLSPSWAGQSVTIVANGETQITGLTITNPNTRGTAVWVETGSPTIVRNWFVGSDREGIFVSGNGTPTITDNMIEQNGGNGLVFTRDSAGVVNGNVIRNQGFGMAIGDRATPTIRNNQIRNNKDGMVINGVSRPVLESNQIEDNGRDGIVVTNDAKPTLNSNKFADNGDYDLHNATKSPLQVRETNLATLKVQGQVN